MDLRILVVFLPVVAAATWALFNVFKPAKDQLDDLLDE